jgi:transposase-like protein
MIAMNRKFDIRQWVLVEAAHEKRHKDTDNLSRNAKYRCQSCRQVFGVFSRFNRLPGATQTKSP